MDTRTKNTNLPFPEFDECQIQIFREYLTELGIDKIENNGDFSINPNITPLTIEFCHSVDCCLSSYFVCEVLRNLSHKNNPIKLARWEDHLSAKEFQFNTVYISHKKTHWEENIGFHFYNYAVKIFADHKLVLIQGMLDYYAKDEEKLAAIFQSAKNHYDFIDYFFARIKSNHETINPNFFPLHKVRDYGIEDTRIITTIATKKQFDLLLGISPQLETALYLADICHQYGLPEDLHQLMMKHYRKLNPYKWTTGSNKLEALTHSPITKINFEKKLSSVLSSTVFKHLNNKISFARAIAAKKNATPSETLFNLMIAAPIISSRLVKQFQMVQKKIIELFKLNQTDLKNQPSFFYIQLSINLRVTKDKKNELQKKLSELLLSAITIEIDSINMFPNGMIYLQIRDIHNQLAKLKQQIDLALQTLGIQSNNLNFFSGENVPYIPLYLAPAKVDIKKLNVDVTRETIFLTSVSLMNRTINNSMHHYETICELPKDILLKTIDMQNDYFYVTAEKLYQTAEFLDNPVAQFYRFIDKRQHYWLSGLYKNTELANNFISECQKNICDFFDIQSNPNNPALTALQNYTWGLLFYSSTVDDKPIFRDFNNQLTKWSPWQGLDKTERRKQALNYFNKALEFGYIGALKNIARLHLQLNNYLDAKKYFDLAMNISTGDPYTEKKFQSIEHNLQIQIQSIQENKISCNLF